MATKSRKAAPKSSTVSSTDAILTTTRLKKLAVEVIIPHDKESKSGKLNFSYQISLLLSGNNDPLIVVGLQINGIGVSTDEKLFDKTAFTFDAVFEGLFSLSSKPKANEWVGREVYLANYLVPILADMIETLLSKCGYSGILIPRSIPNQLAENVP